MSATTKIPDPAGVDLVPTPPGEGRYITGPAALTGDWVRFWHLTFNIAKTQWKMRFFGSVLGYFWQLIRPLMLFGVLWIFWTKVVQIGRSVSGPQGQDYGSQLLAGIVLFTFFQEATMGAVRSVVDNEALVRKIHFPRLAIPLATVLVAFFNLCLNLIVVLIFASTQGVHPMWTWLEVPPILIGLALLAAGIAMLVSALFVYFRDIQPIWEVVCQILFYATPIMIPMAIVIQHLGHDTLVRALLANPLAVLLEQFKHAVVNHSVPGPGSYFGYGWLLVALGIGLVLLALGYRVFSRTAPFVAENL